MNSVLIALEIVIAALGIVGALNTMIGRQIHDLEKRTDLKFETVNQRLSSLEEDMKLLKHYLLGLAKPVLRLADPDDR